MSGKNNEFFVLGAVIVLIIIMYASYFLTGYRSPEEGILNEEDNIENSKEINNENNNKENIMENLEIGKNYTTESGLQYEVLSLGDGKKPEATDTVEVHYHGTLLDGNVFDSSVQRGEKISFGLNQVIAGWTEGLQLMPVGSKFKFTIPADLAYGDLSPSPLIPAGSTLVFEVELFGIK